MPQIPFTKKIESKNHNTSIRTWKVKIRRENGTTNLVGVRWWLTVRRR